MGSSGEEASANRPSPVDDRLEAGRVDLQSSLLSQKVHGLIRQLIVTGELSPGDRVVESAVARQLGISQAPVRDAVRRLAQEGLLTHYPRRGHFVTVVSASESTEVHQLRAGLEWLSAQLVTGGLTPETDNALESAVGALRTAARSEDLLAWREADMTFHSTVIAASGNQYLIDQWAGLQHALRSLLVLGDPFYSIGWSEMAEEHATLLELLRSGSRAEAALAFARHAAGTTLDL